MECVDTVIGEDVYLQGPVLLQRELRVAGSCAQTFERGWVVVRPWSVAVYEAPGAVGPTRAPMLLPTSNLLEVSTAFETPAAIELRTLDFSRVWLSPAAAAAADGAGGIASIDIEVWREAFRDASRRVEALSPWDQGVSKISRSAAAPAQATAVESAQTAMEMQPRDVA